MKKFTNAILVAGATLSLGACNVMETCSVEKGAYDSGPHGMERTAGTSKMIDYRDCHMGGDRSSYAYTDERTKASDGQPQEDSSQK
jgi:hypothetical protein